MRWGFPYGHVQKLYTKLWHLHSGSFQMPLLLVKIFCLSEIKHYVAQINYLSFYENCVSIAVTGIEILPFYSKKFKDVNVTRLSNGPKM